MKFLDLIHVVVYFLSNFLKTTYYPERDWGFLVTCLSCLLSFRFCCCWWWWCCCLILVVFLPESLSLTPQILGSNCNTSLLNCVVPHRSQNKYCLFLFDLSIKCSIEKIILSAPVCFLKAKKQTFCLFCYGCKL